MPVMEPARTTAAAEEIRRRWHLREAPDGDFIVFADGSPSVMNLIRYTSRGERRAEKWIWEEILKAADWTAAHWVDVDVTLASCAHARSRAMAGESAAHGSIGWVALTRENGALEWIAISRDSNPFNEVVLDETTVTATSTAGTIWAFPRYEPQRVKITRVLA
jgi:hypothetical protein